MLILTDTDETIQVDLTAAITTNQLQCVASYRDTTATNITAGRQTAATNSTTAVNVVSAPAASTQRLVEYLSVYNSDTASAEVLISLYDGTALFTLFKCVLGVGERMDYQHGQGWQVFTNSGAVKTSLNQGTSPVTSGDSIVVLSSDVANAEVVANTLVEIPGLAFPVIAGNTYDFEFKITYTAAATSTGSRWVLNGPTFTSLVIYSDYSLAATTRTDNNVTGYNLPAACNTGSGATAGNIAFIRGTITPSANGDVTPWFASEITVSEIRAKAGSTCRYRQVL